MSDRNAPAVRVARRDLVRGSLLTLAGWGVASLLPGCAPPVSPAAVRATAPAVGVQAPPATPAAALPAAAGRSRVAAAAWLSSQEGNHLIPSFSSFTTVIWPTSMFFNGLTRPGPDLAPTPDLAESWTIAPDGLAITFTLRRDVKFHDGQPFTARDVKFTWEVIAHPDNKTAAQLYNFFSRVDGAPEYNAGQANEIKGVRVVDDYTLEVRLSEPFAPFLSVAAGERIIPYHILKDVPVADMLKHPFARAPIGTGPFKFEVWKAGDSITGTAYDAYHGGRPALDRIVYRMAPRADGNQIITMLKSGEVNVSQVSLQVYDDLQGDPSVKTYLKPGTNNMYIEFNLRKPLFEDLRVRKALSYALNRRALADAIWQGRAQIYNSVFPYDWWPTKPDTTMFDNDPEQAKRLLDEAGWRVGSDGIRERNGQKLAFTMYSIYNDWPLVVQQQWRAVGVDMKHEFVDFPTLTGQYYTTRVFDAVGLTIPYGVYTDPHYALPGYFLSQNNRNGYNNPRSDELIAQAAGTYDQARRRQLYHEWQEVIAQDVPHLWLGNPNNAIAHSAELVLPDCDEGYRCLRVARDWYFVQ